MAGVLRATSDCIQNMGDIRHISGMVPALTIINTVGLANCDAFEVGPFVRGSIHVPANVTSLTWYGATTFGGTYTLVDGAGTNGVQTVAASKWAAIPDACFNLRFLKCVPNADPTAAEAAIVLLKT